ncbi:MAG: hypothetical protein KME16_21225 [Scytolyngbya sp. HA4215-MV1]|jgi:hypothetical protein|nr:hypothetical protein [Scytolyngbya sp. HA4215-MV1]
MLRSAVLAGWEGRSCPIKNAIVTRAAEIDYPVEAVIEMAIAGYLDLHAIGFVDCKPDRKA